MIAEIKNVRSIKTLLSSITLGFFATGILMISSPGFSQEVKSQTPAAGESKAKKRTVSPFGKWQASISLTTSSFSMDHYENPPIEEFESAEVTHEFRPTGASGFFGREFTLGSHISTTSKIGAFYLSGKSDTNARIFGETIAQGTQTQSIPAGVKATAEDVTLIGGELLQSLNVNFKGFDWVWQPFIEGGFGMAQNDAKLNYSFSYDIEGNQRTAYEVISTESLTYSAAAIGLNVYNNRQQVFTFFKFGMRSYINVDRDYQVVKLRDNNQPATYETVESGVSKDADTIFSIGFGYHF